MKHKNKVLCVFGAILKFIGNALWFVFTGLITGIMYFLSGLFWCITIIGIPFGKQSFKLARLSFFPFGTKVNKNFGKHPIANVIWIIFGGLFVSLFYALGGIIWSITILGIPFGKQCFKLSGLALMPFGATFGAKNSDEKEQLSPEQLAAREEAKAEKKRARMERRAEKKRIHEEQHDARLKKKADITLVLSYILLPFGGVFNIPLGFISYALSKKSSLCIGYKRYRAVLIFNVIWLIMLALMAAGGVVLGIYGASIWGQAV